MGYSSVEEPRHPVLYPPAPGQPWSAKRIRGKVHRLHEALAADPAGAREVYRELFPEGLSISPVEGRPQRWRISGRARLEPCKLARDPNGIRRCVKPHETARNRYHLDGEFRGRRGFAHRCAASM